jgi:hypothetical protein
LLLAGPYTPDAVMFLLTLVAIWLILTGRDLALMLCLAAGALTKETVILLAPLVYTLRATRWLDWPQLWRAVLVGSPAIAILIALRLVIPAYNDDPKYVAEMGPKLTQVQLGVATHNYADALQRVTAERLKQTPIQTVRELAWGSAGLLWILPWFGWASALRRRAGERWNPAGTSTAELLLRSLPFLALTYFGYWMALTFDRRLANAFPLLIIASLRGLDTLGQRLRLPETAWIGVFAV